MDRVPATPSCPECEHGPEAVSVLGRRDFLRATAASAALAAGGLTPLARARAARAEKQAAAEALVYDLYATMDADQKKKLVLAWDHGSDGGKKRPARLMTANGAVGKSVIGLEYNKKQVEILDRVFRSISNGEAGYKQLSRNGKFDNSGDFESIGALIYGEPAPGKKFSLVFSGHHLTVRCDGNSEEATAFGGPLYYGHSPSGYASNNVFVDQTKAASAVFEALDAKQREVAVKPGTWRDEHGTIKAPGKDAALPGLRYADMTAGQKTLVEGVMKALVTPYRKEDGDEVMEIIKANGGMEKICFAFYQEGKQKSDKEPWTYWRLEGPGFLWSFRALPHIHTFVHISSKV